MSDQIEELKSLHYEIRELIEKKQWEKLRNKLKHVRYNHDINRSKTALIVTQSLINHPEILEERYLLYKWFNEDMHWTAFTETPLHKKMDKNVPDKYKPKLD